MAETLAKPELEGEPSSHRGEQEQPQQQQLLPGADKAEQQGTMTTSTPTKSGAAAAAASTRAPTPRTAKGKARAYSRTSSSQESEGEFKPKKKKAPAKTPSAKKPLAKRTKKAKKKVSYDEDDEEEWERRGDEVEDNEDEDEEEKPKKKKKTTAKQKKKKGSKKGKEAAAAKDNDVEKLPPPLGLQAGAPRESFDWAFVEGFPNMAWKVYGDPSLLPSSDSPLVVSLNNCLWHTGDSWRREQGYAGKDPSDFVTWNSAALPALRAAASGGAGSSVFATESVAGGGVGCGRGLSGHFKPHNYASKEAKKDVTAAVAASTAAAEAALAALPPAPSGPRPLLFVASDGIIKGALLRGKRSKTLQAIFDTILGAEGLNVPCVALLISSKTKDNAWPALTQIARDVGLPEPDASKSTFVAGAVGKNHFGPVGQNAPPSDADLVFAAEAGFPLVLEVAQAFGPTELAKGVEGRHGYIVGHTGAVASARAGANDVAGAAGGEGALSSLSAAEVRPAGDDGTALIDACERVLGGAERRIKNNRRLVAFFKALEWVNADELGERFKAKAFAKMADTIASMDDELGVLTFETFAPLCKAGGTKKLPGLSVGACNYARDFFETGTSEVLKVGGGGRASWNS